VAMGNGSQTESLAMVCAAELCWSHGFQPVIVTVHEPKSGVEASMLSPELALRNWVSMTWLASCKGDHSRFMQHSIVDSKETPPEMVE
jgi:hypothetical protein